MIRGEKIILRTVREDDIDILFGLRSDIANRGEYYPLDMSSQVEYKKRFQEHGFWEETKGTLVICAADTIVGSISFFPAMYYNGFEIAYILFDTTSRQKGYMTEALSLLSQYLFSTKTINRLQLTVIPGNQASKRVAEKCGFKSEGIMRGAIFHHGENRDLEMFSLLRGEAETASWIEGQHKEQQE